MCNGVSTQQPGDHIKCSLISDELSQLKIEFEQMCEMEYVGLTRLPSCVDSDA